MESTLLELASKEGMFAVLFVALFIYQIVDSRNREKRLMDFIEEITKQFDALARQYEKLADDVEDIHRDMQQIFKK